MDNDARVIATTWLDEMQACVRAVDFARCRAIFAPGVVGFGTRIDAAVGLHALEHDQWRHIWGRIRNFTFQTGQLHAAVHGGSGLWLACPWTSEGRGPDGDWRLRPGRITAVLERRDGAWLAVHTHHSVTPDAAAQPASEERIRPARAGEGAALGALTVRSKRHWGYDEAFMAAARDDLAVSDADILNDAVYVLERDGRTLGYCHLRPAANANNEVRLESLFLEPDAIGSGRGRRLFAFAAWKSRELGFGAMVFESDPNAEPFYFAMGAVRTGTVESTIQPGRLLPLMRFDLTAF